MDVFACSGASREWTNWGEVWNCPMTPDLLQEPATEGHGLQVRPPCETIDGSRLLYSWTRGASDVTLPADSGFRIGGGSGTNVIVLLAHYNHGGDVPADESEITLSVADHEGMRELGVLTVNTYGTIPADGLQVVQGPCRLEDAMTAFAVRVKTHSLGTNVTAWLRSGNNTSLIISKDPKAVQSFQRIEPITMSAGDSIITRCTFLNKKHQPVRIR